MQRKENKLKMGKNLPKNDKDNTEMTYLSEAVHDKYQLDKFNVIKAPCGCGKSYYAVNILPQ